MAPSRFVRRMGIVNALPAARSRLTVTVAGVPPSAAVCDAEPKPTTEARADPGSSTVTITSATRGMEPSE